MAKRQKRAPEKPASEKRSRPPRPRQQELIEDRRIKALDDVGHKYAEIRDARIELNREESALKELTKKLMHQHDKTIYKHGTVEIILSPGEEEVKVKIKPEPEIEGGAGDASEVDPGSDQGDAGDSAPAGDDEAEP